MKIWHVIYVYQGDSPLRQRQDLFLESLEKADTSMVQMVGGVSFPPWSSDDWLTFSVDRDSTELGDTRRKPYLKDLLSQVAQMAEPDDWILYTNGDCSVVEDFYSELADLKATVVEYQRLDVENEPRTLDELFSNPNSPYTPGIDGLALRASFYRRYCDVLPDFIIGEPWWDPTYSWILRALVPVRRLAGRLYHPKHEQLWDVADHGVAGQHNYRLMRQALELGHITQPYIWEGHETTDTAVVTCLFGRCPLRLEAALKGLREQLKQDLFCHHYLVEMLEVGQQSRLPCELLDQFVHLKVICGEDNRGLFQKEALFNLAWKEALKRQDYKYFIFSDADIFAHDRSWFRQIRSRLRSKPSSLVHGYRVVEDSLDPEFSFSSLGALYSANFQTDLLINPGLCWGFHRKMLEQGDGFNPYCIECAGDTALVTEYLNHPGGQYDDSLQRWPWYQEIKRELSFRAHLDAVPVDLVHCYHGPAAERNYHEVRRALSQTGSLKEKIFLDGNGLLAWRQKDCIPARILQRREELKTPEDVERVLSEYGVATQTAELPTKLTSPRELLEWEDELPAVLKNRISVEPPVVSAERYPVFCPTRVFRKAFPASWCDHVVKVDDTDHIPMRKYPDSCRLRLEGLPEATYMIGLTALQPTWMPVDITEHDVLSVKVYAEGRADEVLLELVSLDEQGQEWDSEQVKLFARGLQLGQSAQFEIELRDFLGPENFKLERVRTVKFLGYGSFVLEAWDVFFKTSL